MQGYERWGAKKYHSARRKMCEEDVPWEENRHSGSEKGRGTSLMPKLTFRSNGCPDAEQRKKKKPAPKPGKEEKRLRTRDVKGGL